MTDVTVLGAGNMGSALGGAFLAAGHTVTVWNRNPERCASLVARGATLAETPTAAIAASDVAVACVIDYAALQAVLDQVDPGTDLSAWTLVNLSTGTPDHARTMAAEVQSRGGAYLDGAIPCYPASVGKPGQAIIFSGDPSAWSAQRGLLVALGGQAMHVSADVTASNILDLALVGAFYHVAYAGFIEAAAYASALGARVDELAPFAAQLASGFLAESVVMAADAITARRYETDQATVDVHLDAMLMIQDSMRAHDQRPLLMNGLVTYLEEARRAGRGGASMASVYEAMRDPAADSRSAT